MSEDPEPWLLLFFALEIVASLSFYGLSSFLLLLLLLLSAIISGSEVAFFSLRGAEVNECQHSHRRCDKQILALLARPQRLLATILIVNNMVNIAFVTLSTFVAWRIVGTNTLEGILITALTGVVTFCIVLFGEIIPKVYAAQNTMHYARLVVLPLYYVDVFLSPVTVIFCRIHSQLKKHVQRKGYSYSRHSLQQAIDIAAQNNTSKEEEGMLRGIMHLSSMHAREIMQPRHNIAAFSKEETFHDLLIALNKARHSRVPIYSETLDKIEGILYSKDLLRHLKADVNFPWQRLLRPAYFVPENRKIGDIFRDFQKKRVHMAIIVDEYGGTSGLITMEDVIEEIVGDIRDESDDHVTQYKQLDAQTYVFEAKVSLNDFCKALHLSPTFFDAARNESYSLAGLILELHGTLPEIGTKITYRDLSFTIVSADKKRIKTIRIVLPVKKARPVPRKSIKN